MHVLIVIPARGGSKGLPGKNLRPVAGVSLVGRAAYAAREFMRRAGVPATVFVDTDSEAIAVEGRRYGAEVPFLRPSELAGDTTSTADSVLHAVAHLIRAGTPVDVIVLLQPTSPLRTADDIAACWQAFDPVTAPSVISTVTAAHPPELSLRAGADGTVNFALGEPPTDIRRQAFQPTIRPNGAVYVLTYTLLRDTGQFIIPGITRSVNMPEARSIDIDTASDLAEAEAVATLATVPSFGLSNLVIGGDRCCVIADACMPRNDDNESAHTLIDAAADCGADAIACSLHSSAACSELVTHASARGIVLLASPSTSSEAGLLDAQGVPAFSVSIMQDRDSLGAIARAGRPLLLACTTPMHVVLDAVSSIRKASDVPLAILHGPLREAGSPSSHLKAMAWSRNLLGVPAGWNDTTQGMHLALAAVANGAQLIQKRLAHGTRSVDDRSALSPDQFAIFVAQVRDVSAAVREP